MKILKLFFVSAAVALTFGAASACAQNNGKKNKDAGTAGVTSVTEQVYKAEIEDYTDGEWKYLGTQPAVVDFYADWCGPCRKLAPVMDKMAEEYAGKVRFYKVNVDNARNLSAAYGIRSIPAVFFIPASGEPQMNVGLMSEDEFRKKLDALISLE